MEPSERNVLGFKLGSSDQVTGADIIKALLPIFVGLALKLFLLRVMRRAMIRAAIAHNQEQQAKS